MNTQIIKNVIYKTIIIISVTILTSVAVPKDVKAYDPTRVVKYDATVTDNSLASFGADYDYYIPAAVKSAFLSEGGMVYVIPHNLVDSRINLSGWAGGTLSNVTGYLDPNGGYPKIYLNSKVVDNANRYNPGTSDKVVIHEFGHFVCLEANKIRNGSYSYTFSENMKYAFTTECNNYRTVPGMSAVLVSSFDRNTSISEFYANVFAAMILEPANAQAAFPNSCAAINADIAEINGRYASSMPQPQLQQQDQAIALQQQQAQAIALQQQLALQQQAQALALQQQLILQQQAQALALQQQAQALAVWQAMQGIGQ